MTNNYLKVSSALLVKNKQEHFYPFDDRVPEQVSEAVRLAMHTAVKTEARHPIVSVWKRIPGGAGYRLIGETPESLTRNEVN